MAKFKRLNPRATQTWDDLEKYENFCREYGYKFKEEDLYKMKTYPFQQFNKYRNGKRAKDQWSFDARRFRLNIGEHL